LEVEHENYAFILPVDEKYWLRLCQRKTAKIHVFIRKSQVAPLQAKKLLFYVIGNESKTVLGVADFLELITGNYLNLWKRYGSESCFESFEEYKEFALDRETMTCIRFTNFHELNEPKSSEEVADILGPLHRFNVVRYLDKESALRLM
jgi:predicted transcriptional regulator